MFCGAQPISQKLMVHHLLDFIPFGCSDNIIVILLMMMMIIIIITIITSRKYQRELL